MSVNYTKIGKLTIIGLENGVTVVAMYNPKELGVNKSVPWTKHKDSKSDQPSVEFSAAEGRSMDFELMFDTYEEGLNVHALHVSKLMQLAMVMDPDGAEDKKRPTRVKVQWANGALPAFEGVIESIGTKYTMFLPDGTPVRATCNVKVKEASRASFKKGA
jgi:hypothetical protein